MDVSKAKFYDKIASLIDSRKDIRLTEMKTVKVSLSTLKPSSSPASSLSEDRSTSAKERKRAHTKIITKPQAVPVVQARTAEKEEDALSRLTNSCGALFGVYIKSLSDSKSHTSTHKHVVQILLQSGMVNIFAEHYNEEQGYISFPLSSCDASKSSSNQFCVNLRSSEKKKTLSIFTQSPWEAEQLHMMLNGSNESQLFSSSPSRPLLQIPSIVSGKLFYNTSEGWIRVFVSLVSSLVG